MSILDASKYDTWSGGVSFSLRNRLYRGIWSFAWLLFAAWTPPPAHRWRIFLLRLFGARIGSRCGVYGSARIWSPAQLQMGHASYIGPRVRLYSMAKISIGDHTVVSQGAHLCAGDHDIDDERFQLRAFPIAAAAFVGPGVTIHDGAVLGARACAFRDVAAWTVSVGNPAREVRRRASPHRAAE